MRSHQVGWLGEAEADGRTGAGLWARLVAPIITAILVIALGATVFGLMAPDAPPSPATARAVR